ncbi:hypothetical protein [Bacillus sp. 1P06AnD]|uniref:hypothetical protein n=1 Tax=Bacillus sp. 1P06AnD TaxID=3132208 RepID=UPI0039A064E3
MKKILTIASTLLLIAAINLGISIFTKTAFIDFSFAVGLIFSVLIWYFTSKGGATAKMADSVVQFGTANFKMKTEKHAFSPSAAFYTSLSYTVLSALFTFLYYKSYFL